MRHSKIQKVIVIILKTNLPIKHFAVIGFMMHAYIYAKRRKNKKDQRLAIEQERRQYNAWFNVRRRAFRGLDEVAFRRMFRSLFLNNLLN